MDIADSITISVLNATFWLIGLIAGLYYSIDLGIQLIPLNSIFTVLVADLIVFCVSMLFFGYFMPVIFMVYGTISARLFVLQGSNALLFIIPFLIAAYAGIMLGTALKKEIDGKANILDFKKNVAISMGVSLMLALLVSLIPGFIAPIG